jgi:hypothetical protein
MKKNIFCTDIENIIKNNIKLISRYISNENSVIENLLSNICDIYFDKNENKMYDFVNDYINKQYYEKYNYKDKMIEIIKYIISYNIYNDIKNDNIEKLNPLTLNDINEFYEFYLISINEHEFYTDKSYSKIHFKTIDSKILDVLNKYISAKYKISSSGILMLHENDTNILDNIYNGNIDFNSSELTRYISDISTFIPIIKMHINNNINKILNT